MANNRMWLAHKHTGERVLLAKLGRGGWYVMHENLVELLNKLFEDHEHVWPPGGSVYTPWPFRDDWRLEYEHETPEESP